MMKQLVRAGKAFPNRLFVAISLLLCVSADGALAAQKGKTASPDCASASHKNKPPCAVESPTGQVTIFWPRRGLNNRLARAFNPKMEVWIDKANVGMVVGAVPLTLTLPNGPHKLELKPYDDYLENIRPIKEQQITVAAQNPLYFQIVDQGVTIVASELDAPTAQAVLSGGERPKDVASTSQAAVSQAAVSGNEPKGKPSASPSRAAPAGNDTKTPSVSGTVYLYWPKPGLGLGFLDKYASDLPVFLDGKRIGAIKIGEYLMVKTTPGEHAVGLDVGLSNGRLLKKDFILGAGATNYFHVENQDTVRLFEDSPEDAADYKGLTQREAIVQ